jgi:hypothetical protein
MFGCFSNQGFSHRCEQFGTRWQLFHQIWKVTRIVSDNAANMKKAFEIQLVDPTLHTIAADTSDTMPMDSKAVEPAGPEPDIDSEDEVASCS